MGTSRVFVTFTFWKFIDLFVVGQQLSISYAEVPSTRKIWISNESPEDQSIASQKKHLRT